MKSTAGDFFVGGAFFVFAGGNQNALKLISSPFTEWVSAPTEM